MFQPWSMVSFWSAKKVSSYLARAKVYLLKRTVGSFKSKNSRCQVCLSVNDEFRYRWNNYKSNSRNYDCNQPCIRRHLYEHYSSVGYYGFLGHVSITLIDKNDSSDPLKRKDYWGCTLCTMEPYGLNIDDHVWLIPVKILKILQIKRIFILWKNFTTLRLYDKEYLMLLTSLTTVQ